MKTPISIIIPNYDGEAFIQSIIDVIRPYYDKKVEIIIVDDGSNPTDKTCQLLKSCFQEIIIVKQSNKGLAAARNAGVKVCSGTYIQFLDIDDTISANKIFSQLGFAIEKNLDVVYSDWQMVIVKNKENKYEPIVKSLKQKNILNSLINGWWQPIHSYLIRKTAYEAINGSDENLTNAQDFDLIVRLALNGAKFGYLEGNFSQYFRYIDQKSLARGSKNIYWESYDSSLKKCFEIAKSNGLLDEDLSLAFANKWFHLARNIYKFNRPWAFKIIKWIKTFYPNYMPEKESILFRTAYSILGYSWSEKLADFCK